VAAFALIRLTICNRGGGPVSVDREALRLDKGLRPCDDFAAIAVLA